MATDPGSTSSRQSTTRVYLDMVGDLFHAGHVALLRAARGHGHHVIVGVLSDDDAASYKRRPVMSLDERVDVVAACRYVDEVVPGAPLVVDHAFLARHRIDVVVHGDDLTSDAAREVYGAAIEGGMMRFVSRTSSISTSALIQRILDRRDSPG